MSRVLARRTLHCHPATACAPVSGCTASITHNHDRTLTIDYAVAGTIDALVVPAPAAPHRSDGLWRTTCFELFIAIGGEDYLEFNFSPSGSWAAYRFNGYRADMCELALPPPQIALDTGKDQLTLTATLSLAALPEATIGQAGMCAVIEASTGDKSYWALTHPRGAPDFHHPDCFAFDLGAALRG